MRIAGNLQHHHADFASNFLLVGFRLKPKQVLALGDLKTYRVAFKYLQLLTQRCPTALTKQPL